MTINVYIAFFILRQGIGHFAKCLLKLWLNRCAIERKSDIGRHVENQVVTIARYINAGSGRLLTQFFLLLIHVIADPCASETAKTCTDNFLRTVALAADKITEQITAYDPAYAAYGRFRDRPVSGFRIGDAPANQCKAAD